MPSTTIDSLALQIQDNSKTVVKGLDKLATSLQKLGKVTQGLNLGTVSSAFKSISTSVSKLDTSKVNALTTGLNKLEKTATKSTGSFTDFAAKLGITYVSISTIATGISSMIKQSTEYIENINLFAVSLGNYADEAMKYAEQVQSVMGIDLSDWIRNQSIFMTLATGFGVASDQAYTMSKNLTQLGYDISSFFNLPIEESMQKLQSGLAGELEPLRRIGYDLSVARLQQEAYNLGIEKSVNAMTQAEKAQLRYYAIMTQVTTVQGDMARTLEQPANQIRILTANLQMAARAIGNIFIPALNAILPVAIAVVQIITEIANAIASLFGFEIVMPSYDTVDGAVSGTGEVADNLDDANSSAKKLKNNLLGIDELNIISPDTDSGSGSGAGAAGGGFDIEVPEYDFLGDAINERIEAIKQKIKELLPLLEAIATAIAAMKLSKLLQNLLGIENLGLWDKFKVWAGLFMAIGGAIIYFQGAVDALTNGVDWDNLIAMIGGLAMVMGGLYIALKPLVGTEMAGLVSWIAGLAGALGIFTISVRDMAENGVNLQNLVGALAGLSTSVIALNKIMPRLNDVLSKSQNRFARMLSPVTKLVAPLAGLVGSITIFSQSAADLNTNGASLANVLGTLAGAVGIVATAIWGVNTAMTALAANPVMAAISGALIICGALFGSVTALIGAMAEANEEARNASVEYQRWAASMEEANKRIEDSQAAIEDMDSAMEGLWDSVADYEMLKSMADEIYELSDKANKSVGEIQDLSFMVDTFNSTAQDMGIDVSMAFDEVTGAVTTNRDEIYNSIEALEAYALKEAVLSVAKDMWANKIQAMIDYQAAVSDLNTTISELDALEQEMSGMSAINEDGTANQDYFQIADKITELNKLKVAQQEAKDSTYEMYIESEKNLGMLNGVYAELSTNGTAALDDLTLANQNYANNAGTTMATAGTNMKTSLLESFDASGTSQQMMSLLSQGITDNQSVVAAAAGSISSVIALALKGVDTVGSWLSGGSTGGSSGGGTMYQTGYDATSEIATGITDGTEQVGTAAQDLGTTATESITAEGGMNPQTSASYTQEYTGAINDTMVDETSTLGSTSSSMATQINTEFTNVANYDVWHGFGSNLVAGLEAGIESRMSSILSKVRSFASQINQAFDSGNFDFGSPSKRYIERGQWMVEGFNIGMERRVGDTYKLVSSWGESINATANKAMQLNSSSMVAALPKSLSQNVYQSVDSYNNIREDGFDEVLTSWYQSNIASQMNQLVDNTQRQADKNESVTVQIGNQEVANAVKQQQRANGYSFIRG